MRFPRCALRPGVNGLELPAKSPTVWPKGSTQEVAWAITANHGGGYSYRLCPKGGWDEDFHIIGTIHWDV
jgi:hypothetical protein